MSIFFTPSLIEYTKYHLGYFSIRMNANEFLELSLRQHKRLFSSRRELFPINVQNNCLDRTQYPAIWNKLFDLQTIDLAFVRIVDKCSCSSWMWLSMHYGEVVMGSWKKEFFILDRNHDHFKRNCHLHILIHWVLLETL